MVRCSTAAVGRGAERGEGVVPRRLAARARRLGQVAQDGGRARRAAAGRRRASAMADRSCASSTTTWPHGLGRAVEQAGWPRPRARPRPHSRRGARPPAATSSACSPASSRPSAAAASRAGWRNRRWTTSTGFCAGHAAFRALRSGSALAHVLVLAGEQQQLALGQAAQPRSAGVERRGAGQRPGDPLGDGVGGEHDGAGADREADRLGGRPDAGEHGPGDHGRPGAASPSSRARSSASTAVELDAGRQAGRRGCAAPPTARRARAARRRRTPGRPGWGPRPARPRAPSFPRCSNSR